MKIMFICHGNICRSPMAEFIMKAMLKEQGFEKQISVSSCAVSAEEIGNPVYPPARRELAKHGISCDGKYAIQLKKQDYDQYDLFIVMDDQNLFHLCRIFPSDPEHKVHKLLEYAGSSGNVADPWYTGDFSKAYEEIQKGCAGLFNTICTK